VDSAGATGKDHRVRRAAEEVSMSESAIFGESGQLVACAHLVKLATCHMKTMRYNETVMAQFSCDAVRQGCTLSELIKTALRKLFRLSKKRDQLPPLPTFRSGGTQYNRIPNRWRVLSHSLQGFGLRLSCLPHFRRIQ
jgi:hypothetical protein